MEKLEMVEQVRKACNVSYEEARDALEACDYDVLETIVKIERSRKPVEPTVPFTETKSAPETGEADATFDEVTYFETLEEDAGADRQETDGTAGKSHESKVGAAWKTFCERARQLARRGMVITFVMEREGERVVALPVLFVVLGMLFWGAALWLLVIGLFFGFRYHIEGIDSFTVNVNEAMSRAADVADGIKDSLA